MKNSYDTHIALVDSTLRDGMQAPGIVMSYPNRAAIAQMLIEFGITEIEAGIPAIGSQERKFLATLTRENPGHRIIAWCRAIEADLRDAQRAGCQNVHISFPVSDILLQSMEKDLRWLFSTLDRILEIAKEKFEFVSVGAMDASRANSGILEHFCKTAVFYGADRVRIADTLGVLTARTTGLLFENLSKAINPSHLEFHAHNDFGMATANALSAAECGVGALSVTVNGMGERAGNAALEEVVMVLRNNGISLPDLQLSKIQELCDRVSHLAGQSIPSSKPIIGDATFLHESGIHWKALLHDNHSFEPFEPALVGHPDSMPVAGSHSGGATVRALMLRCGEHVSEVASKRVAGIIRKKVQKIGRVLTAKEVKSLCKKQPDQSQ